MTRRDLMLSTSALASAAPASAAPASLAWIAGRWLGRLPWGTIEEIWSPASGGVMMGMFRMISGGKAGLYEFMTLEQKGAGVCLKLRHFDGGFKAREAQDQWIEFDLTAFDAGSAAFVAHESAAKVTLVYRKSAPDSLLVDFEKIPAEGKTEKMTFPYRRTPL